MNRRVFFTRIRDVSVVGALGLAGIRGKAETKIVTETVTTTEPDRFAEILREKGMACRNFIRVEIPHLTRDQQWQISRAAKEEIRKVGIG